MKGKDSRENKGYAFITFRNKELASKAIKDLNNKELKASNVFIWDYASGIRVLIDF